MTGRFWSVKISAVENFVLATVCDLFHKQYNEELAKASLSNTTTYILNS